MNARTSHWRESLRVVWAITAKDIVEGLKNKNTLSIIISSMFLVAFYRGLPSLVGGIEPPQARVYDAGASTLTAYLENSPDVEVRTGYESEAQVRRRLANADTLELGLVIPADFDQVFAAGAQPVLQGHVAYWVSDEDAAEVQQVFEGEIARLLGRQVRIELSENRVYPTPEDSGPGVQVSIGIIIVGTMIGVTMVPHLMLEEKHSRTLDVLLVSPASETQVILSKALVGLFYCLLGLGVALVVNRDLVVHWDVVLLVVPCVSLLTVSIGLWLGTKIDTRAQLMLWAWVFFIPMFLPVFLYLLKDLFPDIVGQVLQVIPTAAALIALNYAYADTMTWGTPLLAAAWLLVCTGMALAGTVWLIRRRDRVAEGKAALREEARLSGSQAESSLRGRLGAERRPPPETHAASAAMLAEPVVPPRGWRMLLMVAAKDLREAFHNKVILGILVGTVFVVINGAALPLLLELQSQPSAMFVDEGRSTIIRGMSGRQDLRLALADTRQELEESITGGPGTWIGLIVPADFDQRAGSDEPIELEGYVAHWANPDRIREWTAVFERELGLATWGSVQINLEGHELYPAPDVGGQIGINLYTLLIAVLVIGMMMVPLLMVEERESHTLEALLISPAKLVHVIAGKALVGIGYCCLAAGVTLLFNRNLIVHWDIAVLATLLSAAFAVSLGIVVGLVASNATAVGFWGGPLMLMMIVPTLVQALGVTSLPMIVQAIFRWVPTTLMLDLFRLSVAGAVPGAQLWSSAAALVAMAGAVFLLATWRLRQYDR
jgi:ABC-type Na+ efflux pump permease subunit